MRLSRAQKRVLEMMIEHNTTVYIVIGRDLHSAFFSGLLGQPEGKNVRPATIYALQNRGLVRNITDPAWRWRGGKYEITEAGRAAVGSYLMEA